MSQIEKFKVNTLAVDIVRLKEGCHIPFESILFEANRKAMRGLEERLADLTENEYKSNHDYQGTHVYGIQTAETKHTAEYDLIIRFSDDEVIFGNHYIY